MLLDGVEFGLTPFAGEVPPGQHEVSLSVEGLKNLPASKSVNLDYGDSQSVSFRLNVKKGYEISNGRVGRKGMVTRSSKAFKHNSSSSSFRLRFHKAAHAPSCRYAYAYQRGLAADSRRPFE